MLSMDYNVLGASNQSDQSELDGSAEIEQYYMINPSTQTGMIKNETRLKRSTTRDHSFEQFSKYYHSSSTEDDQKKDNYEVHESNRNEDSDQTSESYKDGDDFVDSDEKRKESESKNKHKQKHKANHKPKPKPKSKLKSNHRTNPKKLRSKLKSHKHKKHGDKIKKKKILK